MRIILIIALGVATKVAADESVTLKKFVAGNHAFAGDVYTELAKEEKGNFLFCPQSAEIILGLTRLGAKERTAEQLSKSLHIPEIDEEIVQIFKDVIPTVRGGNKYTLNSANKIYVKHGYQLNDQFKSTAADVFDAEIENINFVPEQEAADKINAWVEEKTQKKITKLIDPKLLDKNMRSVLINALYFKGTWIKRFDVKDTRRRPFRHDNTNRATDSTDMMVIKDHFNYYDSAELKAKFLEMPYDGDDITMTFVLPHEVDGLSALESRIHDVFDTPKYVNDQVYVEIPKFTESSSFRLKKILQNLGVEDIFENYANLSGMFAPGEEPLKVSEVVQKTFIEVDEEGTTAASSTAVLMPIPTSLNPNRPIPKTFIADHPFIYYLRSPSGVMFVGRYVKP